MKPKIVGRAAFHVVGLRERFLPGKIEAIPKLWDRFIAHGDVANQIPGVHYGVCVDDPDPVTGAAGFLYTACAGVTSLDRVPAEMVGFTVPAGSYAVFTHRGSIREIGTTIAAVWRDWLPAAGLRASGAPDFERYDERFRMESPDSEVDLYVPIVER